MHSSESACKSQTESSLKNTPNETYENMISVAREIINFNTFFSATENFVG